MRMFRRLLHHRRSQRTGSTGIVAAVQMLEFRQLLAGNVAVSVNPAGNILRIIGDNADNAIDVSYVSSSGRFLVTAGNSSTKINGGTQFAHTFSVLPSIRLRMQDGNDSVTGTLIDTASADSRVIDEGFFRMGRGNDSLNLRVNYVNLLTVIGDSGIDKLTVRASNFAASDDVGTTYRRIQSHPENPAGADSRLSAPAFRMFGFDGNDILTVTQSSIIGTTLIEAGNQNDNVYVKSSNLIGSVRFDAGAGHDNVDIRSSNQGFGRLVFKGRTGNDSMVFHTFKYEYAGAEAQPFRYDGDTGNDMLSFRSVDFSSVRGVIDPATGQAVVGRSGTFSYVGGVGVDRVYIVQADISVGGAEFDFGPDNDAMLVRSSTIVASSSTLPGNVATRGGGRLYTRFRGGNDAFASQASTINTTGKVTIDGDAGNDLMAAVSMSIVAGSDVLFEGNYGIDDVLFSGGSVASQRAINIFLGESNDDLVVRHAPTISGSVVRVDGSDGYDRLAFDFNTSVTPTPIRYSLEDVLAPEAALTAQVVTLLANRATLYAGDTEGVQFQYIASALA